MRTHVWPSVSNLMAQLQHAKAAKPRSYVGTCAKAIERDSRWHHALRLADELKALSTAAMPQGAAHQPIVMGSYWQSDDSMSSDSIAKLHELESQNALMSAIHGNTGLMAFMRLSYQNSITDPANHPAGECFDGVCKKIIEILTPKIGAMAVSVAKKHTETLTELINIELVGPRKKVLLESTTSWNKMIESDNEIISDLQDLYLKAVPREAERLNNITRFERWMQQTMKIYQDHHECEDQLAQVAAEKTKLGAKQLEELGGMTDDQKAEARRDKAAYEAASRKFSDLKANLELVKTKLQRALYKSDKEPKLEIDKIDWEVFPTGTKTAGERCWKDVRKEMQCFLTSCTDIPIVVKAARRMYNDWDVDKGQFWLGDIQWQDGWEAGKEVFEHLKLAYCGELPMRQLVALVRAVAPSMSSRG